MFDNTPEAQPSAWEQVTSHAPIVLIFGGLAVAFIGLHSALTTVGLLALLHVALGIGLLLMRRFRHRGVQS